MNTLACDSSPRCDGVTAAQLAKTMANRFLQDPGNPFHFRPLPDPGFLRFLLGRMQHLHLSSTRVLPMHEGAASTARAIFLRLRDGHQHRINPTPNRKRNIQ